GASPGPRCPIGSSWGATPPRRRASLPRRCAERHAHAYDAAPMLSALLTLAIATLPERIFIKTHDQSFSWENDYALRDGKLWVKPNPLGAGTKGDWALFDGTGLPGGKKAASFRPDSKLVEFATEGLMVVAVSEQGRFYFWQPTLFEKPTVWHDEVGQPLAGPLQLPPHRD